MPIVSLTTDFGYRDFYSATLKAELLQKNPGLDIIDITHAVVPFDIMQASFIIKTAYHYFPKGSIHIILVNNSPDRKSMLLAYIHGHYFILPDNGLLSLVFQDQDLTPYRLTISDEAYISRNDLIAHTVNHISNDVPLHSIGALATTFKEALLPMAQITKDRIRATIIYINNYGNCITNLSEKEFNYARKNRAYAIYYKDSDPILSICENYKDVEMGEALAHFHISGYLEIAMHMQNASTLLNLKIGKPVQIEFYIPTDDTQTS